MAHFRHLDDLIREYLLFRGFTITLKSFDGELKVDKDRGFRIRYASYGFDAELNTLKKLEIEKKWKDLVNKERFDEKSKKKKFYVLSMFPYPSGNLHMGHVRVYTISDTAARFYRLKGLNVLHPIGFDSFGLPAENAARENKVDPEEWTSKNINKMRNQLKELGCNFDWEREIITSKPQYYKFTQLLFLLLYKHNLVYRKKANVNWDPVDKTVLADEQVDSQGRSWRSGALVEKKMLKQWFIKTTNFAEDLYDGLNDNLKDWRDVINLQKHWIGKCDGADFKFYIEPHKEITVWVEKPEHMKKAAFFAVSPQSVLASEITQNSFLRSRLFKKKIPIYITDEINYPEGCDLKLGIPSQNQEDKNFAIKHNIEFDDTSELDNIEERTIICNLAIKSNLGGYPKSSKLKDWLISRQRYWGTPIPIIHCPKCKEVPVPEEKLPVLLSHKNQKTSCPNCGSKADYESDTMDTFVDSSWYFLRYIDPDNTSELFSKEKAENLMPVDVYIGGKEHAILHLYYARFISHFLYSIGCLKYPEPFKSLLVQGMVMGKTYYVKESLKCIRSDQVEEKGKELFEKGTGLPVIERWEKMSKSKHNGVEPSEILKKYGTDTTRLIILSEVAPTSNRQWNEKTSSGILNWQQRLWVLMSDFLKARNEYKGDFKENEKRLYEVRNTAVKGTSFSYASSHQFSAAISRMQSLTNSLKKFDVATMAKSGQFERTLASLLVMLFPMAPHFTSELWSYMQKAPNRIDNGKFFDFDKPIQEQQWPQLDDSFPLNLVCKVNNAVKAIVEIPSRRLSEMSKEEALNIMLQQSQVREFIACCDILSSQYNYENFEGTISILIDHVERRKFISKEKSLDFVKKKTFRPQSTKTGRRIFKQSLPIIFSWSSNVLCSKHMFIMWFSHYLLLCLKMWRNNKNMIVDKIVDQFLFLINNCDLNSVRALWSHFDLKIFSKLDYEFTSGLRKLESSLYKYYLVNAVSSKNPDKVNEFFAKMTHELQGQPEWKDWFMLPFIEKPEEHPTFNVHFTKQWQDTFLVSLHNFLSIIYQVMPQPALSSYEEEATKLRRLQEENDALKHKLATLSQCANVVPEAAPPMDIMDDFYIIAQESPTSHNENHPKTFKNLIRTIGGGLPTSPIMGRKPQPDEQFGVQKHHSSKRHTSQGGWIKQTSTTSVPKRSLSLDSRSRRRDASVESLDKRGNKKDNFLLLGQEKMCEHKSAVTQCKFNATGSTIASCDSDGVIKIWSAEPQIKVHSTMEFKSGFTSLSWLTKNERFFVTGSRDGIVRLHDSKESKTLWEIGKEENSILANTKILSLCCSPTECSVACSAVNINERTARLLLYDIKTKKIEQSFSLGSNSSGLTANCCQFNHNGSLLIVGCSDGSIRTLDLRNGECVESWGAHEGCVCAIQITSDHNSCYTLGADHKLCKYDLAHSGEPTLRVSLSNCQLSHGTQGFTLHQSGKLVLTACGNLGANIYQVTEGCVQSMLSLGGHRSPLTTCDWSTANQCSTCLSSSADGKIKISTILTP